MSVTITHTTLGHVLQPLDVLGYRTSQSAGNIEHDRVDGGLSYTLRPDGPRSGSLRLLFWTATTAADARDKFALPGVWALVDTVNPTENISFIRFGNLGAEQQDARRRWVLDVGFRQVPT